MYCYAEQTKLTKEDTDIILNAFIYNRLYTVNQKNITTFEDEKLFWRSKTLVPSNKYH